MAALAGIAADLGQLGPAIGMLSQSESELSLPFTVSANAASTTTTTTTTTTILLLLHRLLLHILLHLLLLLHHHHHQAMATELDALRELCERQVQLEHVSGLASLLAFNSGMAASLKEVLANRDAALLGYETAGAALEPTGGARADGGGGGSSRRRRRHAEDRGARGCGT